MVLSALQLMVEVGAQGVVEALRGLGLQGVLVVWTSVYSKEGE